MPPNQNEKELVYKMINEMDKKKSRSWLVTLIIGAAVLAAVVATMWLSNREIEQTTQELVVAEVTRDQLRAATDTLQFAYVKSVNALESIKAENRSLNRLIEGGQVEMQQYNEKLRTLVDENTNLKNSMNIINQQLVSLERTIEANQRAIKKDVSTKLMSQVRTIRGEVRLDTRYSTEWRNLNLTRDLNNQ